MASTYRSDLFAGQVALVSGGTSGIGAAIGDAFAAHGATVTVTGATTREVEAARGRPGFAAKEAVVLDVRDVAAVNALVGAMPRLDLLVNCAGTLRRGAEHDPATFDDVVDINLSGTMRLCAAARPKLARDREGRVVIAEAYGPLDGNELNAFKEGLALVSLPDSTYGYLDRQGALAISARPGTTPSRPTAPRNASDSAA